MITQIFKNPQKVWFKAMLIILVWVIAMAYLVHYYGPGFNVALADATIYTGLIIGGLALLENIFKFYHPRKSNLWFASILPLLISVVLVYLADYLLGMAFSNQPDYLAFLEKASVLRGTFILILFYFYLVLLGFYGRLEDQLQARQRAEITEKMAKEAELFHLRQQLQPHFLFNSLNSINALIKRRPEEAREMVLQLSDFLRGTIRKDDNNWISVEEESEYLRLFMGIEKVRFGHRLTVEFIVGEESKQLRLPQLLVQPLLENAIKHGLYGMTGEVTIQVHFEKQGNYLEIRIANPFDPRAGQAKGEGFGLEAVKRRLYLLFGRNDLIGINADNEVFSVRLKIPQNL